MAARPVLVRLALARSTAGPRPKWSLHAAAAASVPLAHRARPLHTSTSRSVDLATSSAASARGHPPVAPSIEAQTDETKHAAFLGEADSNDGFEAFRDAYGAPPPSLDTTNAAYLGEADSDDGFESQIEVQGKKLEPLDASQAAYLGEADSDDGFEAAKVLDPEAVEKRHRVDDPSPSGLHGQVGEQDQ